MWWRVTSTGRDAQVVGFYATRGYMRGSLVLSFRHERKIAAVECVMYAAVHCI
jgi:hypothetical protein